MLARMLCLTVLVLASGCQQSATSVDPETLARYRQQLLLEEEPPKPLTPIDLQELEGFTEGEVVLVGRIGGLPNPYRDTADEFPWKKGVAAFYLADPGEVAAYADHSQDDPDHAENCPFCARHAGDYAQYVALVVFNDEAGKPIPVDAQELLSLKEDSLVVVRGWARLEGERPDLMLEADGIYIRD